MSNEMIERVARAIRDVVVMRPSYEDDEENLRSWERTKEPQRGYYMAEARAAIEAMREPTIGMIAMGGDEILPERMYRIMIDAALDDDMVDKDRK